MSYIKRLLGKRTEVTSKPRKDNPLDGMRCIEPGDLVTNGERTGLVLEANLEAVSTGKWRYSRILVEGKIVKWYNEDIDMSSVESGRMAQYRIYRKYPDDP